VDSELEVIRDEMEQTRANLADKLGALENQVRETVSGATDAVNSTVEGVKEVVETVSGTVESVTETFNVSKQVEQHPWMAFGAAVAVGFVASQLFGHSSHAAPAPAPVPHPPAPPPQPQSFHAAPQAEAAHREPEKKESPSILGSLGHSALESVEAMVPDVKDVMHTVVSNVGGLAVGSLMSVVRDLAAQGLEGMPKEWTGEVTKLIDQVTTKLGGKVQPFHPRPAQPQASHQPEQGRSEQPREEKRQEGVPYDTHTGQAGSSTAEAPAGNGPRAGRGVRNQPATGKV